MRKFTRLYPILGYSKKGFRISFMNSLHAKEYRDLIGKLVQARKDAGLAQVQVAKILKKPQSFISKVETFQRRIDVLELKRFAAIYKKNLNDLL